MITKSFNRFRNYIEARSPYCKIFLDTEQTTTFFEGVKLLAFGFWSDGFAGLSTRPYSSLSAEAKRSLLTRIGMMQGSHEIERQKIGTQLVNRCVFMRYGEFDGSF